MACLQVITVRNHLKRVEDALQRQASVVLFGPPQVGAERRAVF